MEAYPAYRAEHIDVMPVERFWSLYWAIGGQWFDEEDPVAEDRQKISEMRAYRERRNRGA